MKYRIKNIRLENKQVTKARLIAKRRVCTALSPYISLPQRVHAEKILLEYLFDVGALPEAKRLSPFRRFLDRISRLTAKMRKGAKRFLICLFSAPSRAPSSTWLFLGAMCAAICVAVLSAATVLVGLFGKYFAPYDEITIPSLVGKSYTETEELTDERLEILVSYENSDTISAGVIMSQTPTAGVRRKLFRSDNYCVVSVTVSAGKHFFDIPDLSDMPRRDALLILRNAGVAVKLVEEHSDTVKKGQVISSVPPTGQRLYDGEELTLIISLGKAIPMVKVPDLYGLNEVQAISLLTSHGLRVGEISYSTSDLEAGKVIAQQYTAYSMLTKDSTVNITVSLGKSHTQRHVPDLYGLSVDEAKGKLAEVGLVVGNIYAVSSGAPSGTVVSQSPLAGTPITSTIISIDIYVSS